MVVSLGIMRFSFRVLKRTGSVRLTRHVGLFSSYVVFSPIAEVVHCSGTTSNGTCCTQWKTPRPFQTVTRIAHPHLHQHFAVCDVLVPSTPLSLALSFFFAPGNTPTSNR